jgi:hypothetical protein
MRFRTLRLSPDFLIKLLQGKSGCITSNLPADTELLDLKYDLFSNQVLAVIRSDSFEEVAESRPAPEFTLTFTAVGKSTPLPAAASVKPELTPPFAPKSEAALVKKAAPKPSGNTGMIEEEFSPDQRKLLSFRLEGDCVIVKPTQFLKAEWDDINETVRSLGGKWVKGDIISYWAIPLQQ